MRGVSKSYEYSCLIQCVSESIPHLILQIVNNSLLFPAYPPGTHSPTYLLTHSPTHLLTHSLTHLLTHLPTYSLNYLLTHLLVAIFSLMFSCAMMILAFIDSVRVMPDILPPFCKEDLENNPLINTLVAKYQRGTCKLYSYSLTRSLTHILTHLLTHLLTHSLTHLLTYSLMSRVYGGKGAEIHEQNQGYCDRFLPFSICFTYF